MQEPIWITEADVVALMDLKEAIGALESALKLEAAGQAANMTKTLLQYAAGEGKGSPGHASNNLHAIGAKLGDYVGTKTWAHTQGGTSPIVLLWDANDGSLAGVIEAFAMGNMRTGGISGVAADWMAAPDASVMAIAGAGKQALSQVGTMLAVRPIRRLNVYSPTPEKRAAFVKLAAETFGIEVVDCDSMARATTGAQIVTLVTRAGKPFVDASMLEKGTFLNAVGAIAPDREEFAQDVFPRVSAVAVDNLAGVQQLSREFMTWYGAKGWDGVQLLSGLIASGRRRQPGDDLTLFKAMGMGISDLALGTEVLRRARERGVGRVMPQPKKVKPRVVTPPS
jgi:alanine dehydrogenase